MLALPGGAYVYQGDELGLEEVEDLPDEVLQDPIWRRSGHTIRGRDGCRVPLPWNGAPPALGFGSHAPWLPQPAAWANLVAARQADDPESMLRLYRQAIALRRLRLVGEHRPLVWHDAGLGALSFSRGDAYGCLVNVTGDDVRLDPGATVLLASGPLEGRRLPTDTTAWVVASGG
jgi:alpha-glucosidase